MFCTQCGTAMRSDQQFCGSCGKAAHAGVPAAAPVPAAVRSSAVRSSEDTTRVSRHIRSLGLFWIVLSGLGLLKGSAHLAGARALRSISDVWLGGWGWPIDHIIAPILGFAGGMTIFVALAGLAAGWGLMERRPWARTLALVVACLALFRPVIGTVLGIFTLWVLLPGHSEDEYRRISRA